MADIINITITEPEPINISITEPESINIIIHEAVPVEIARIFEPPEGGQRITKLFWKDGKFQGEYET